MNNFLYSPLAQKALLLEQQEKWNQAAACWRRAAQSGDTEHYLFQAEACELIAEVKRMNKIFDSIDMRCRLKPTGILIVKGKTHG